MKIRRKDIIFCVFGIVTALAIGAQEEYEKYLRSFHIISLCAISETHVVFWGRTKTDSADALAHLYLLELRSAQPERLLDDEAENRLQTGTVADLERDPKGKLLAFVAADTSCPQGANKIWLLDLTARRILPLVANGRDNCSPRFSPDGSRVAFFHAPADRLRHLMEFGPRGFALSVVQLETGEVRQLAPEDKVPAEHAPPSWSPDGEFIVFSASYGVTTLPQVYKVRSSGGELAELTPGEPRTGGGSPVWTIGGRIVYHFIARDPAGSGICTVLPDGTGRRLVFPCSSIFGHLAISPDGKRIAFEPTTTTLRVRRTPVALDENGNRLPAPESAFIFGKWLR
jgi:hypothetical protein